MAELFELSFCTSGLAPKSKLLRSPKVQYGFILKRSHHSGKNTVSLRFTEKAAHCNQNINIVLVNFIKVFDRITHRTLFIETSYMDGLLSIGRVFQREARCFCRCDGWVSDRRLKLVRWRSDRKSSLLNGHRRPSHQIRRRRRQIQPSQAEFFMFLSKSLNYNGKERLWKTSMSREEGKRKSRITWKRDRT